jgi:hypothetical protein
MRVHPTAVDYRSTAGRWALAGALIGLAAGVVFAMFEMVVADVRGEGFWMPIRMIGAIVLGKEALEPGYGVTEAAVAGMTLHLALSALYGGVFGGLAAFVRELRSSRPLLVGAAMAYGLALWLVNFYGIAPAAFPWFQDANPVVQFVAHAFVFGAVLGLALAAWRPSPRFAFDQAAADRPLSRERYEPMEASRRPRTRERV